MQSLLTKYHGSSCTPLHAPFVHHMTTGVKRGVYLQQPHLEQLHLGQVLHDLHLHPLLASLIILGVLGKSDKVGREYECGEWDGMGWSVGGEWGEAPEWNWIRSALLFILKKGSLDTLTPEASGTLSPFASRLLCIDVAKLQHAMLRCLRLLSILGYVIYSAEVS